jgi:F0F1-type ATP synthase membrane subunit b/b'
MIFDFDGTFFIHLIFFLITFRFLDKLFFQPYIELKTKRDEITKVKVKKSEIILGNVEFLDEECDFISRGRREGAQLRWDEVIEKAKLKSEEIKEKSDKKSDKDLIKSEAKLKKSYDKSLKYLEKDIDKFANDFNKKLLPGLSEKPLNSENSKG